jgi:hypothetical protein
MSMLTLLFIVDIVLVENDCFGWTTTSLLAGLGLAAYFGADVNPFVWAWANVGSILEFFLLFWAAGALWSVLKWYLYLLKVRDRARKYAASGGTKSRPRDSYASENKYRIMGWIAYWPFSMVGSIFGDFLSRIVKNIYRVLSSLYEAMGDKVFSDFED